MGGTEFLTDGQITPLRVSEDQASLLLEIAHTSSQIEYAVQNTFVGSLVIPPNTIEGQTFCQIYSMIVFDKESLAPLSDGTAIITVERFNQDMDRRKESLISNLESALENGLERVEGTLMHPDLPEPVVPSEILPPLYKEYGLTKSV